MTTYAQVASILGTIFEPGQPIRQDGVECTFAGLVFCLRDGLNDLAAMEATCALIHEERQRLATVYQKRCRELQEVIDVARTEYPYIIYPEAKANEPTQ